MTLLELVDHHTKIWTIALPHVPPPTPTDAIRWCEYPQSAVELAIIRASKRFAPALLKPGFVPTDAYVYTTGTARLIAQQSKAKSVRSKVPPETQKEINQ